jgi:uncharacterized protein YyaL (SSP411 family)
VFVDQEAYIIEKLMVAAATLGETAVEKRARATLDVLLQRTYVRGWDVRHAIAGVPPSGVATPQGLLQDQVQVASACLTAHQVGHGPRYLVVALDLVAIVERNYADSGGGYYDVAAGPPSSVSALGDRTRHVLDDLLPGANAAMARLLARLAQVTGDRSYRRRAQATLESFAGNIPGAGVRATTFLAAARETLAAP